MHRSILAVHRFALFISAAHLAGCLLGYCAHLFNQVRGGWK